MQAENLEKSIRMLEGMNRHQRRRFLSQIRKVTCQQCTKKVPKCACEGPDDA